MVGVEKYRQECVQANNSKGYLLKHIITLSGNIKKIGVFTSVYHVNTQESSFSNSSYPLIIILLDNQFSHVITKTYYEAEVCSFRVTMGYLHQKRLKMAGMSRICF